VSEQNWDSDAEVRCEHVSECGACPLMPLGYERQRLAKLRRLAGSLGRYRLPSDTAMVPLRRPSALAGYRRRAKLVVSRTGPTAAIGLFRRNDNQVALDLPGCQVLSPGLLALVAALRPLVVDTPPELAPLLEARGQDGAGVLSGIDARELTGRGLAAEPSVLLTLTLAAEHAATGEELKEAARALRRLFPRILGVAAQLKVTGRPSTGAGELVLLSGESELEDALSDDPDDRLYQLVSHNSFLHVHRGQAAMLHRVVAEVVAQALPQGGGRILDLYAGTGALSLTLARAGHSVTAVESFPGSVALATRAATSQRLAVEVVAGEVASVTKALLAAGASFDVVVANPPRRGLSPAAREAIASLRARRVVYVACEVDNLSRDLDHFGRLGMQPQALHPLDMLPLTDEVEVVAVLEPAPLVPPVVLFSGEGLIALAKPPHEPVAAQPEYPSSLVGRAAPAMEGGAWEPIVSLDPGVSGVCLFAKDAATAERWRGALARTGRLIYLAAARGVTPTKGAILRELRDEHDNAMQARTRYRRLALGGGHSILRVVPERPVPHQIRRHFAAVGHPVLGDMRYGHAPTNRYFEEKHGLDRSFLHLVRIEVEHPDTGERLYVEAPLSADLRAALQRASDDSVLQFLEQKGALGTAGGRFEQADEEPKSELARPSLAGGGPESLPSAAGVGPSSLPGRHPLDFDEAPRTVRGELVGPGESDDG